MSVVLYGRQYELDAFDHPGGSVVIRQIVDMNIPDVTSMFESYHPFGRKRLTKILGCGTKVDSVSSDTYNDDGFFCSLKRVVIAKHGRVWSSLRQVPSIENQKRIIALMFLWGWMIIRCNTYLMSYIETVVCGFLNMGLGITLVHNGGHWLQPEWYTHVGYMIMGWCPKQCWAQSHHWHHAFTGDTQDPDIQNYGLPTHTHSRVQFYRTSVRIMVLLSLVTLPGHWLGVILQSMGGGPRGVESVTRTTWSDWLPGILGIFGYIWLFKMFGVVRIFLFAVGMNTAMFLTVSLTHCTSITDKQSKSGPQDWGERQVRGTSNVVTQSVWCFWWLWLLGGTNYQIEHHLFPGIAPCHYPALAPLVKKHCESHNLVYAEHLSLFGAIQSFVTNCLSDYQ